MITNERQYRITRKWLENFEKARGASEGLDDKLQPRARQAFRDQYDSQIEELGAQLAEYDALRRGEVATLELDSLRELPEALIRARTAAGLSQAALAERLGLRQPQVQRYEATRYAGVDLERLQAVADALGMKIREQVVLPVPAGEPGAQSGDAIVEGSSGDGAQPDQRAASSGARRSLRHEEERSRGKT